MSLGPKKRIAALVVVTVIVAYSFAVGRVFLNKHLIVPRGKYPEALAGDYQVVD